MGKLLCEKNLRDVWCRNGSVRAEIGQILQTHRHTHVSKLVVEITYIFIACHNIMFNPIGPRILLKHTLLFPGFLANVERFYPFVLKNS